MSKHGVYMLVRFIQLFSKSQEEFLTFFNICKLFIYLFI